MGGCVCVCMCVFADVCAKDVNDGNKNFNLKVTQITSSFCMRCLCCFFGASVKMKYCSNNLL